MFKIHKIANKISPTFRFFISFLFLSFYQELSAQKPEDSFVSKAKELINEKKYSEAELLLKQADAFGSGEANYYLGMIYYSGWGQEKNYAESFLQFLKSSQRGFGLGDYRLGICYLTGNGVEKDKTRSTKAFQKGLEPILQIANNKQDMEAMYILGRMYEKGYGVEINYPESIKWYAKSAELGHSIAQTHLGVYYEQGLGVEQNQNEAVRWYSQAAEKGYATAQYNLGLCYELGSTPWSVSSQTTFMLFPLFGLPAFAVLSFISVVCVLTDHFNSLS